MKAVPHERYCLMLTDEMRRKRYACVDLGGGLSAIVSRKTGTIKLIYESVANLCCMKSYEVYVVKNYFKESFVVCFDRVGNMRVSEKIDKVYYCLENYVICQKYNTKYVMLLNGNSQNLVLKRPEEVFSTKSKNYVILNDLNSRLCFVDIKTLKKVGPTDISAINLLQGKNWIVVRLYNGLYSIVRTTDFKYSESFEQVIGYRHSDSNSKDISEEYVVVTKNGEELIYSIEKLEIVGNAKNNSNY